MPTPRATPRRGRFEGPGLLLRRWGLALLVLLASLASPRIAAAENACMTHDPGWGVYQKWSRGISMGQLLIPQKGGMTRSGGFDLIVHFHGHYPIRKEFVKTAKGVFLAAIDLGVGSGAYYQAFASPRAFEKLLDSIEEEVKKKTGRRKVHIRKLGLSSWSAGYGAVAQILDQPAGKKVDALILLDSVHAGYADASSKKLRESQLKPFLAFARRATRGQRFMFQSHSSIIPPGYASTQEVSHFMVDKLGGRMRKTKRDDVLGLKMFERYDRGNYHVRGYRGDDKPDHCAHLGLMADVMKVHIKRRWRTPVARRGKRQVNKALAKARAKGRTHVVKKGQTLSGIAGRYGTSSREIRRLNGLRKGKPIRIGQELIIPAGGSSKKSGGDDDKGGDDAPEPKPGEKVHKVYKGQSLGAIARRYHVTVDDIRERNGLEKGGRPIQPGDELIIPNKKKSKGGKKRSRKRRRSKKKK